MGETIGFPVDEVMLTYLQAVLALGIALVALLVVVFVVFMVSGQIIDLMCVPEGGQGK